jgi:hypothetical protein
MIEPASAPVKPKLPLPLLALALLGYFALVLAYALCTPPWQAPDEPAHYNYTLELALTWRLPVLQPGDYPHAYLEELKGRRFPPELSVQPLRYEGHQPPLYYAVLAPLLALLRTAPIRTQVLALRLATAALGGFAMLLTLRLGQRLWPARPAQALALSAFCAYVPMHAALAAAINNDILGELMLLAALLGALRIQPRALQLGLLLGLCLLAKTTAYIALPLALLALGLRLGWRRGLRLFAGAAAIALALALPWLARNLLVYGWADPLGWRRHDAIVVGQPRTAELLSAKGLAGAARQAAWDTFRSFWGVFGWMGVPMDERLYYALALATAVALAGLAAWASHVLKCARTRRSLLLLGAWGLLSLAGLAWYNIKFAQHQGRYLFNAMPVWGAIFTVGLKEARRRAWPLAGALLLAAAGALALGQLSGDPHSLAAQLLAASGLALAAWAAVGRICPALAGAAACALLWALALAGALYYVQRFL